MSIVPLGRSGRGRALPRRFRRRCRLRDARAAIAEPPAWLAERQTSRVLSGPPEGQATSVIALPSRASNAGRQLPTDPNSVTTTGPLTRGRGQPTSEDGLAVRVVDRRLDGSTYGSRCHQEPEPRRCEAGIEPWRPGGYPRAMTAATVSATHATAAAARGSTHHHP